MKNSIHFKLINSLKFKLKNKINFKLESLEDFIFCTSCFLLGIILYYNFNFFSLFLLPVFLIKRTYFLFFILGLASCFIRFQNLNLNVQEEIETTNFEGVVEKTYFKNGGLRAVISNEEKKIIASFKKEEDIKLGDKILIQGLLLPLPKKVYPNFYDVENKNKFQGISAYFSVKKFEVLERSFHMLQVSKTYVLSVINKMKSERAKSIAIAILLGDKGKISKEDYNLFKKAGLAHILAISGLHMSIFAGLIFAFFFQILAFTKLSITQDTKKIAGIVGLICGLFYLLLAGIPISGLRSFIMVFFLFAGYIFYRGAFGVRGLTLALIFILLLTPEEVSFPSFQLSFASVLCLLKCYNIKTKFKIINIFLTSVLSSFVVSFTTLPFVIHHFGFVHLYGFISNIIAIPILAVFTMPFAIISIITNSETIIYIFEFSINLLFIISEFVSSLPFSSIYMKHFNGYLLTVFSFGIIFTLNFKNIYKVFGILSISSSILFYIIFSKQPFLVVNQDYAVIKDGENYISLFYIPEGFLKEVWQEKLNSKFIPFFENNTKNFKCENGICFNLQENKFTLIYEKIDNLTICTGGILVNMVSEQSDFNCNFHKVITLKDLKKNPITPFIF